MSKFFPKEMGFRMPGEFEPHFGCWMLWPRRLDTWREKAFFAHGAFAQVANSISIFERVFVGVAFDQLENARKLLNPSVTLVDMDSDDAWARDVGPTFLTDGRRLAGVDWKFNAWGGLYPDYSNDEMVASRIINHVGALKFEAGFIMEGGSFHSDGDGTLLTTEECLLNPNRNPGLSKEDIEDLLKKYLNVSKVIWLPRGVWCDETSGHVDNMCCFASPGEVVLTWTDDIYDPQYERSLEAFEILSQSTDAAGRQFKVHKIHQPGPLYVTEEEAKGLVMDEGSHERDAGSRLAGSYVNFYMANEAVIAPVFGDPYDMEALRKLREIFPSRRVVPVYSREILLGGGNIHCITQQQPLVP